jgi:2-methylcitrate dehydratase PrpD
MESPERAMESTSPSRVLADFAFALRLDDVPPEVRARAKHLIVDAVGVALASTRYPFVQRMLTGLSALGGGGDISLIGLPQRLTLRDAATMNAALIHGLDFDDTHMASVVHATCVSLPSALALGEALNAQGGDILSAYIIAVEAAIRIGQCADYGFHRNGYHATGVVGHFSSALAAGRVLGLSAEQLACAQGVVLSTAMASREFMADGSWNKRLHPGWAAVAGITVAYLVRDGFIGSERPYDGRHGLYTTHMGEEQGSRVDFSKLTCGLGRVWMLLDVAVKPFPTCHYTHALIDSAIALKNAHGLAAKDIANVRILIPEQTVAVLTEPRAIKYAPTSDYAAKFSAPYTVACALAKGRLGLSELEDEALHDREVLALCARCACEVDPDSAFPEYFSGGVIVETHDGRVLRHHERVNRGAGERQLTDAEITGKFLGNAGPIIGEPRARALHAALLDMEALDGRTLAGLLRGGEAT